MAFQGPRTFNARRRHLGRTKCLLAAAVFLAPVFGGCAMLGRQTPLEQIIGAPASTERHRQLAELYERKAADARAQAGRHLSIAASYRNQAALAIGPEAGLQQSIVHHCEALVRDFEDAAARYEAMAANHRALADMERRVPPRERNEDRQETRY